MKKKIALVAAGLLSVSILAGVGVSVKVSMSTLEKLKGVSATCDNLATQMDNRLYKVEKNSEEIINLANEEKKADEEPEFVKIDNKYEIIDTKTISDAYIKKDTEGLNEREKETLDMASKVIAEVTNDKMTVYEKELAIYNWMKKNIGFDTSSLLAVVGGGVDCYTPYGVLKGKNAVCVGYATTFKLFMNMLGLECMVEHDNSLSHSWNIVKLDDDEWYLVDVVFDGATNSKPQYKCFNCTNNDFQSDHEWNADLYPIANGTKYSYAAQNATDCAKLEDIPAKVNKIVEKKKSGSVYLRLPQNADLDYLTVMTEGINRRINAGDSEAFIDERVSIDENGRYIIGFNYVVYSESEKQEQDDDEKKYKGLTELLNKYFGTGTVDFVDGEKYYEK